MKTLKHTNLGTFISLNYGKKQIATKDIKYIKGDGNYSYIIYGKDTSHYSSFTLKVFSQHLLKQKDFFQARRGLVINLNHLEEIKLKEGFRFAKMKNGKELLISRRKGKELVDYIKKSNFNITIQEAI